MREPRRILLADDHELFREGIASLLNAEEDLTVVAQVSDGLEALRAVRDHQPDLTILDISMPLCDGLEATQLIRERFPESNILILTVHEEEEKLFEALRSGASGYLLKSLDSGAFLHAVRGALAGDVQLPPKMASLLVQEFVRLSQHTGKHPGEPSPALPELTNREKDVLRLIATRATDKEIADRLTVSIHTVKSHVRNILAKLQAVNRREAARLARDRGLVGSDPESSSRID